MCDLLARSLAFVKSFGGVHCLGVRSLCHSAAKEVMVFVVGSREAYSSSRETLRASSKNLVREKMDWR